MLSPPMIKIAVGSIVLLFALLPGARAGSVSLHLLDGKPLDLDSGVSFGVPWPQGSVSRDATFQPERAGQDTAVAKLAAGLLARRLDQVDRVCHRGARRIGGAGDTLYRRSRGRRLVARHQ